MEGWCYGDGVFLKGPREHLQPEGRRGGGKGKLALS